MSQDLDLKKILENPPQKFIKNNISILFYSKETDFLPVYLSKFFADLKKFKLAVRTINKDNFYTLCDEIFEQGFFPDDKVYCILEFDSLLKKHRTEFIQNFSKNTANIIIHTTDYKFLKESRENFNTFSVFEIPAWFLRKTVTDKLDSYGVVYNTSLVDTIVSELSGKDLSSMEIQLDKLCLFLVDKTDPYMVNVDWIKEGLSGKESSYFGYINSVFRNFALGDYENAASDFNTLIENMESAAVVNTMIKKFKALIDFYFFYHNNSDFKYFADVSSNMDYKSFFGALSNIKKKIDNKLSCGKMSFLNELKHPDTVKDFTDISSGIQKKDLLAKFENIIKMDSMLKNGEILSYEDLFLLLTGEAKINADNGR